MNVIAKAELSDDPAEDRWMANELHKAGIECAADYRYVVTDARRAASSHFEGPRKGNNLVAAAEYDPEKMKMMHREFLELPAKDTRKYTIIDSPLSKVCILIRSFKRDNFFLRCVQSIQNNLLGAKLVIVDDGNDCKFKISWYARLRYEGHVCEWMPFDSGSGAKLNRGVSLCDRPYVLLGSDDFSFDGRAIDEISTMVYILDRYPDVACISGTVDASHYKETSNRNDNKMFEPGGCHETRYNKDSNYKMNDLRVNFPLIRREVFEKVHRENDVKIGHGANNNAIANLAHFR